MFYSLLRSDSPAEILAAVRNSVANDYDPLDQLQCRVLTERAQNLLRYANGYMEGG